MPSVSAGSAPDLGQYLRSLRGQPLEASVETLISLLKRRQIRGSEPCAVATAHILLQVVAKSKWNDVDTLLQHVSKTGRKLVDAQPNELVVANITRRVLGLIRDEAAEDRNEPNSETPSETFSPTDAINSPGSGLSQLHLPSTVAKQDSGGDYISSITRTPPRPGPLQSYSSVNVPKSLFHILAASPSADADAYMQGSPFGTGTSTPSWRAGSNQVSALRSEVIDGIEEIKDEISQADDQIAALAEIQIHPGDYVLIYSPTPTVERFILRAAMKRKFTVLIALEPPHKHTVTDPLKSFRAKLAAAGIPVVNIMNGGLMAYMSRVDKVILAARYVLANGSVISDAGSAAVARAAREHGNAVIALAGVYKLSPEHAFDEESVIEWADSACHVSFADGALVSGAEIRTATTELVPPEFIDTYITNLGTHSRDHLSSLIADHYKQEDVDFLKWDSGN